MSNYYYYFKKLKMIFKKNYFKITLKISNFFYLYFDIQIKL